MSQPMGYRKSFFVILSLVFILSGCGGGNRLVTYRDGEVVHGELILEDLPHVPEEEGYVISYGDVLDISFLYNREFGREGVRVRPDGMISYPYAGEIRVAGTTVAKLDSILTSKFSEIILDPDITVMIREFRPQLVYVMGEVKYPGGYPVERGTTLLKALALGSGPTKRGKENGVLVLRRIAPDHIVGIQIDLKQLIDESRFDLDIPLKSNDIVLVPKSNIAKTEDFVKSLYEILKDPGDLYLMGWRIANVKVLYDYYKKTAQVW